MPGDILLCDLDAFYASVEQKDNPELLGKPIVIGGDPNKRGVVSTCSYEARKYGVRSAMPLSLAKQLCPNCIFLPVNMSKYEKISGKILDIYYRFTPLVEVVSIDEAYLEVKSGEGTSTAQRIKEVVRIETGLNASIGISNNKLLAKIASELSKPDGLKEIKPDQALGILNALPVKALPGIGPKTEQQLNKLGLNTIGKLNTLPKEWFIQHFGLRGEEIFNYSKGVDERPLILKREVKSVGEEITFPEDITDYVALIQIINTLSEKVGYRMRRLGFRARTVTIKVRYDDFQTVTRSSTLGSPVYSDNQIFEVALKLMETLSKERPIRLLGVQAINLAKEQQLSLFENMKQEEKLTEYVDQLKAKFGESIIQRGISKRHR